MKLELVDLSESNLQHLFDWSAKAKGQDVGCKFCLYWEGPDRAR